MPFEFRAPRRGEAHPAAKLSNRERIEVRSRFKAGEKITHLAKEKGIAHSRMGKIVRQREWSSELWD